MEDRNFESKLCAKVNFDNLMSAIKYGFLFGGFNDKFCSRARYNAGARFENTRHELL